MTLKEISETIADVEVALNKAKNEGDLRENTEWTELLMKVQQLYVLRSELEAENKQIQRLNYKWVPPTYVSDTITMGVKVYFKKWKKPIVIVPKFLFRQMFERTDVQVVSTESSFAITHLGECYKDFPDISGIERFTI